MTSLIAPMLSPGQPAPCRAAGAAPASAAHRDDDDGPNAVPGSGAGAVPASAAGTVRPPASPRRH